MKVEDILQAVHAAGRRAFPRGPYRFRNREYLNITYRTDAEALRRWCPSRSTFDEPLVRFEVMKMPDVSGLGSYTECGQAIVVRPRRRARRVPARDVRRQPPGHRQRARGQRVSRRSSARRSC